MLRKLVKGALDLLGYQVTRSKDVPGFRLYSYFKQDGSFDYEKYRQVQQEGNRRKLDYIWVKEDNIEFLSRYIKSVIPDPHFGICHGTRRGKEQEWFRKYLGCEVIGTEISDTAATFPHTVQWDFHRVMPEWIDAADFIYSNSFDHSYDPEMCLNAWMSCIRKGGICIIEHSSLHETQGANELDPFGADLQVMPYLIVTWGKGAYGVRQLLRAPTKADDLAHVHFLVIQKF